MVTYEDAIDQYATVAGIRVAYRMLGLKAGVPLLHLPSFRATMDQVDPLSVNMIASHRPVILVDNVGIGRSEGQVPTSFSRWADHCAEFIKSLGHDKVDVWGFSMGGCVAQMLALNYPHLVRRLILCGSVPSIGPGVVPPPAGPFQAVRSAYGLQAEKPAVLKFLFHTSEQSQAAGQAAWERMCAARKHRIDHTGPDSTLRQVIAFSNFMNRKFISEGSFDRLHELKMPVLIIRGSEDFVLNEPTCRTLSNRICNAKVDVVMFLGAGHACHWQYAEESAALITKFLDGEQNLGSLAENDNIQILQRAQESVSSRL
ncbi:hypothetical protein FSARC_13019, partial [Fusarium sarcochroum]